MFDDLLAANRDYASRHDLTGLPREPSKHLLVLTCMDARIDTLAIFGLRPGDAHVLRNAGGRVSDDAIRSMLVSTRLLGVSNVVVMHHTGCGMADISRRDVEVLLGDIAGEHLEFFHLLEIEDQLQALRDDVTAVRESPLLPPLDVAGFLYDVASGRVEQIV